MSDDTPKKENEFEETVYFDSKVKVEVKEDGIYLDGQKVENVTKEGLDNYFNRIHLQNEFRKIEHGRYLEGVKERQERAKSYLQIVSTIGYLSFFAIWSSVSSELSIFCKFWSIIPVSIALIIFIVTEVVGGWMFAFGSQKAEDISIKLNDAIQNGDKELYSRLCDELHQQSLLSRIIDAKINPFLFVITSTLGAVGGFMLIIGLLRMGLPSLF